MDKEREPVNLFDPLPTKQMDVFLQKLELLRQAALSESQAKQLALKEAGKKFKSKTGVPHKQLSWHFQTNLNHQQYLFEEETKRPGRGFYLQVKVSESET